MAEERLGPVSFIALYEWFSGRLLALAHSLGLRKKKAQSAGVLRNAVSQSGCLWALGSFCALNRIPFDPELLLKRFPPPYSFETLIQAARALGFKIHNKACSVPDIGRQPLPCLAAVHAPVEETSASQEDNGTKEDGSVTLALISEATAERVVIFMAGNNTPEIMTPAEFATRFAGTLFLLKPGPKAIKDPDAAKQAAFGFRWFVPELLKHKPIWRDVLLASLIIQLVALATPLFTQVIIDKVVVHRTESTLIVIAVGLAVFMIFSALLTWVRQYLVLHTGNRVDAVLGSAVFEHLFALPTRYFEHRPTGVISARLHGVESIREFVASAAVTLILDLPFLLIFVAIMFYYSVVLTLIALSILGVIIGMSLMMAPLFQARMSEQFLLGARNQAFVTEYVSGLETVKSLQMEPQLKSRYGDYLADYLHAGFRMKQIGNTYNVAANTLEQMMTLLILVVGAYIVMNGTDPGSGSGAGFTIGMLVAFQMFSGRLSQPMLRLVGLWQQFQQASMSVKRLGDIMNAPTEPYSLIPTRVGGNQGKIEVEGLSFRYNENLPYLYRDFGLEVNPGETVVIMGPSGSGKSTLAKLLLGFYAPADGQIKIDGTDIRHFSANELRSYFGVVPQETVLFSGAIYDNLLMANPHATFDQVVQACRMAEIHDTIEKLPQGYQTEIGERGVGLSGGQKQRLAIARALLKRPKILIFDESTSNLDPHTAEHFARTINQLKGKVTMLFITHALPKSLQVDKTVRIGEKLVVVPGERGEAHD